MDGGYDQTPRPNELQSRSAIKSCRNLERWVYGFVNNINIIGVRLRIDRLSTATENLVSTSTMDDQALVGTFIAAWQTAAIPHESNLPTSCR